ncbi:N-acetylglucosaminyldiphosphoundecaprenol N-acetyl-beta-D-mannosaminyltransferase [Pontibacter ummariensis]|uniref:N-acetylglucosaminyldiphosphoundecaprenol N-acetyl-beta-D-mannosaminyltransferase n=1 Tax=Pontibacter ummariensis TaxID=1610492 RepID=A0A239GFU4_9BACT|nr:WecB/TagA/CpsF family glycosyltransferase [Pontibacter ummariensis]PRY11219.1 N-acetylglucosaminyldiphosphoundecaprenol N-acetyl-beta-D-mannosaminyltransferase [Pontibacter ummariensis]SNS67333.1 N-acetylglucosaminyldiphosphoundecaprenol N-acetyl-beta-D-mannosaminyltransferase [Pontibacter ummariensis]
MRTNRAQQEEVQLIESPLKEKRALFNSLISVGSFNEFVEHIFWLTEHKKSSYVCFANVHMLMEAYQDKEFNRILNNADVATPDGGPLSKLFKLFYGKRQERVAGMDLLPCLLREAAERGKSVFFYGSTDHVLEAVLRRAKQELPHLKVSGYFSPPFRKLTHIEDTGITNMINKANPDLVFVALGCPKQERWMAEHKGRINACMLGVGQAYLTYAGLEKRLPKWARDLSLEWTYRLWQEPGRLWKRYLITNSKFLLLLVKLLFQQQSEKRMHWGK